jgi:ribonuclease E
MDVANYLLNQKRKEIAQLEEEYNLSIYIMGNPMARQNEYEIEFIRRELTGEAPVALERGVRKDTIEMPLPVAVISNDDEDIAVPEESPVQPVVALENPSPPPTPRLVSLPPSPLAMARGRIFWRVAAASRRLDLPAINEHLQPAVASPRGSRSTGGRLTRRSRTWWRRRTPSPAAGGVEVTSRDEPPPANESLA